MKKTLIGLGMSLTFVVVGLTTCSSCVFRKLGGDFTHRPDEAKTQLSKEAQALVNAAYAGIEGPVIDHHVHAIALGTHVSGAYVHEDMQSMSSPVRYFKTQIYMSASGVEDMEKADVEYAQRLTDLARALPHETRHKLLAFDQHYDADGKVVKAETEFYTPDEYVIEFSKAHPKLFEPVISVHPYRADALEALERGAAAGATMVKWLPNAMGIDPSNPRIDAYYDKMIELGLVLLSHTGEEQAVEAEEAQKLGNPLRLRYPLDRGVTVIASHCSSLGENEDLDDPEKKLVPGFDLWLRMMENPKYVGRLWGEISATVQFNRVGRPLEQILARTDLHDRLAYGSDYPLPAINALVHLEDFVDAGYLEESHVEPIAEIYGYNPLLFDFVLKRSLKDPKSGEGLPASLYTRRITAVPPSPSGPDAALPPEDAPEEAAVEAPTEGAAPDAP